MAVLGWQLDLILEVFSHQNNSLSLWLYIANIAVAFPGQSIEQFSFHLAKAL